MIRDFDGLCFVMKQLSPHTAGLIQRLNEPVSLRERITGLRDYESIFSEIAASKETAGENSKKEARMRLTQNMTDSPLSLGGCHEKQSS